MVRLGLCVNCGDEHTANRQKCDWCASAAAAKARTSYHERQAAGLCKCGKPTTQSFKQCGDCRYKDRERRHPVDNHPDRVPGVRPVVVRCREVL